MGGEDGDDVSTSNWKQAFSDLSVEEEKDLLMFLGKSASYHPTHIHTYSLSLGSVNDPIFWGAHNSWERMWHIKRLELATDTEKHQLWWNSWNESSLLGDGSAVTCSWSSSSEATLPWYDLMKDDETTGQYLTNKDMLRMFHPDNKALPHIYDSLEYTHCDDYETDDVDTQHALFRGKLYDRLRKRQAEQYRKKVETGYTQEEADKLNRYYEEMFDKPTLTNYDQRPIYVGTHAAATAVDASSMGTTAVKDSFGNVRTSDTQALMTYADPNSGVTVTRWMDV